MLPVHCDCSSPPTAHATGVVTKAWSSQVCCAWAMAYMQMLHWLCSMLVSKQARRHYVAYLAKQVDPAHHPANKRPMVAAEHE